jgi:restriction endonuclease Mrr
MHADESVARATAHYPVADISPSEFEEFVVDLLQSPSASVGALEVTLHDKLQGADGQYDMDATVRFRLHGMDFLVLVEAKRHNNPIKRELVQVLHAKLQSVGAQKAAMIATAPYQRGALEYAKAHGIALVTVTESRYVFVARSGDGVTVMMTREEAKERFGGPIFVGHSYGPGDEAGSTSVTLLSTEYPEAVATVLLGVDGTHEK